MKQTFQQYGVFIAWVVSVTATLTSLYFSEILKLAPCSLCWYQRICMFPLALILGVATYREDHTIRLYSLPLALIGGSIALFHYLEQKIPFLRTVVPCHVDIPCHADHLDLLDGFITIPFLSFIAFLFISIAVWNAYPTKNVE